MAKEHESIDVWIGHFPTEARLNDYLSETYGDDEQPISELASDMGEGHYDHDFLEHSFSEAVSQDITARLEPHSFSRSYLAAATAAFIAAPAQAFNTVLLAWGDQFRHPASVHRDIYWLHYLGRFHCDPTA